MPECRYCGATFDDAAAHRDHLQSTHEAELGPIDRRRIRTDKSSYSDRVPIPLLAVVGIAVVVVGFVLVVPGNSGGSANGPSAIGSTHVHGTLEMIVDGQRIDFSNARYQYPNRGSDAFHFEGGNGRVYHVHARGVTLAYAMDTLGITVTDTTVTYDGTTYRDADSGTTVTVTVDGESVDPETYVLNGVTDEARAAEGDHVRIVVEPS